MHGPSGPSTVASSRETTFPAAVRRETLRRLKFGKSMSLETKTSLADLVN
jgi:hypothetical protein